MANSIALKAKALFVIFFKSKKLPHHIFKPIYGRYEEKMFF